MYQRSDIPYPTESNARQSSYPRRPINLCRRKDFNQTRIYYLGTAYNWGERTSGTVIMYLESSLKFQVQRRFHYRWEFIHKRNSSNLDFVLVSLYLPVVLRMRPNQDQQRTPGRGTGMGFLLLHQAQLLKWLQLQELVHDCSTAPENNKPLPGDLDCSMHYFYI